MKKTLCDNKKWFIGSGIGVLAAVIFPQVVRIRFAWNLLFLILVWVIVGMGWNVIGGYCGQVSNRHNLFYGIGAYMVGPAVSYFKISPRISIRIRVGISMLITFIVEKPLLRLEGHVFAISTMALAGCARIIFINWKWCRGTTGVYIYPKGVNEWTFMQLKNPLNYYHVFLIFTVAVLVLIKCLGRSKFSYYLHAIKGSETAAESAGINAASYKIRAYMFNAAIASIGGGLYAQFTLYIDPSMLMTLNVSMMTVLTAVMGGVGTVLGPVLRAIVFTSISEYSRVYPGQYGGLGMILYGTLVILIALFILEGILSMLEGRYERIVSYFKNKKESSVAGG